MFTFLFSFPATEHFEFFTPLTLLPSFFLKRCLICQIDTLAHNIFLPTLALFSTE
ncbi:unnamed protein product [Meloidogyne enterolobii]|uniref:Uncharacterized protein n=1 Tax=Meloidogyne enterolobii TaxID=390850 RepID=A0ACB1A9Y8_MELEN